MFSKNELWSTIMHYIRKKQKPKQKLLLALKYNYH